MDTLPKVGIVFGMVAISIFLPFYMIITIAENEALFIEFFYDENIILKEFENTDSYKKMMERYPDSVVTFNVNPHHTSMEVMAFTNNAQLSLHFVNDQNMGQVLESAHCRLLDGKSHSKLGTVPVDLIDNNPPIPAFMFKEGNADQGFTAGFVEFTNCLEVNEKEEPKKELVADHHIAIPENTGTPGCQDNLSCFEPYSLKIKNGEVVGFRNFDTEFHTVTSGIPELGPDGEFDSGLMEAGGLFHHEFAEVGEYEYFCMVHPWQTGKIIVHAN